LKQVLAKSIAKADRKKQVSKADFAEAKRELIRNNHQLLGTIAALKKECCERDAKHKEQLASAEVEANQHAEVKVVEATNRFVRKVDALNLRIEELGQLTVDRESAVTKLEVALTEHKNFLADLTSESDREKRDTEAELTETRQRLTKDIRVLTETIADHQRVVSDLNSKLINQQNLLVEQTTKTDDVRFIALSTLDETKESLNANIESLLLQITSLEEDGHRRDAKADHDSIVKDAKLADTE